MKQLGVLLLPLDGILVHHRVPSMKQLGVLLLPLDGMLVRHRVSSMKQLGAILLPLMDASPSQGTQDEATRSITAPPGWDASITQCHPPRLLGSPSSSLVPSYTPGRTEIVNVEQHIHTPG